MVRNTRNSIAIERIPQRISGGCLPTDGPPSKSTQALVIALAVTLTAAVTAAMLWQTLIVGVAIAGIVLLAAVGRYTPVLMVVACAAIAFPTSLNGEFSKWAVSTTDALSIVLLLPLLTLWLGRNHLNLGPAGWPMVIYFTVCTLSTATGTSVTWGGLGQAVSLGRSMLATLLPVALFANLGRKQEPWTIPHWCFLSYLAGMPVMTGVMLYLFKQQGIQSSMYALGMNKNGLGPALGLCVVISLSYLLGGLKFTRNAKVRLALVIGLVVSGLGMVLSLSRGAWIATAAACLLIVFCTRNFKAFFLSFLVLIPLLGVIWAMLPEQAVSYATNVSPDASSIQERFNAINVVMSAFRSNPLCGVGVGLRKGFEPHNVLILTLGETGIVGLIAFVMMFVAGFYTFIKARRFCQSPGDRQLLVTGAAILLLSISHGMMDVYWRRGIGVFGWVGVGIAVAVINRPRLRKLIPSQSTPAPAGMASVSESVIGTRWRDAGRVAGRLS